jgi:hypothetical protein
MMKSEQSVHAEIEGHVCHHAESNWVALLKRGEPRYVGEELGSNPVYIVLQNLLCLR